MAAALAEMSRAPFDMIESESELGSGYNTEYSGIKFALLQLAEFMAPIVVAAVATALFLGGTRGIDPIPGQIWFLLKAFALIFVLLWTRATWPRLRVDQIMGFAWKGLFPLSLVNIFVVAIEAFVFQEADGTISSGGALDNDGNQLDRVHRSHRVHSELARSGEAAARGRPYSFTAGQYGGRERLEWRACRR